MMRTGPYLLRFENLKERGIVRSREQLSRMIAEYGFPPGFLLSPNSRVWDMSVVEAWLDERRRAGDARDPKEPA